MLFDASILNPFVLAALVLFALAILDFYAFSPRPSGLALRSRELAPAFTILMTLAAVGLSLKLQTSADIESLIAAGANYAPRAVQSERMRLLSAPFVVTSPFESVLLGLALLSSAIFLAGQFGVLGWCLIVTTIILVTGTTAIVTNPLGLSYGPFELSLGLLAASGATLLRARLSRFQVMTTTSEKRLHLGFFLTASAGTLPLGLLQQTPIRVEIVLAGIMTGAIVTLCFDYLKKMAGPHWEATTLFFVTGVGGFVVCGFVSYFAPHGFDRWQWQRDAASAREDLQNDLRNAVVLSEQNGDSTFESETNFATRLKMSQKNLKHVITRAEFARLEDRRDKTTFNELKLLARLLEVLQRLHQSRAAIADVERRTWTAHQQSIEPTRVDALYEFWQRDRPWLDAELTSLRGHRDVASRAPENAAGVEPHPEADALQTFLQALNHDLERLTQAALDVEIRRVDVWLDWAARQPRSRLPSMKLIASAQVARLETLSLTAKAMRLPTDPRINSLHRNLRRMASVSSPAKWE